MGRIGPPRTFGDYWDRGGLSYEDGGNCASAGGVKNRWTPIGTSGERAQRTRTPPSSHEVDSIGRTADPAQGVEPLMALVLFLADEPEILLAEVEGRVALSPLERFEVTARHEGVAVTLSEPHC